MYLYLLNMATLFSLFLISKEWVDIAIGEATSGTDPTYIALKGSPNFLLSPFYQSQHSLQHMFILLLRGGGDIWGCFSFKEV